MKNVSKMALTNCYCGQTGDNSLNMLQCTKCGRWFHEDCVKCLEVPMLFGDRFYIFICSTCNAGSEYLARLELMWVDVMHLVLYNLTVIHKKKYFHLDSIVVPFVDDNWERFQLFGPIANQKNGDKRSKVLESLLGCPERFKCGKEVKKSKDIWALRERKPPEAPAVLPSAARIENDVVMWEFKVKERSYRILTVKKENCKNGKAKLKLSVVAPRQRNNEVSKCQGSLPHHENGVHKAKHRIKRTASVTFNEDSACPGLLDSLIPFPPDFNHCNNPFQKSSKTNVSKRLNHQTNKSNKRRRNGENSYNQTVQNGNHRIFDDAKISSFERMSSKDVSPLISTKDYLSHNIQNSKGDDFCVIGKRITATGKVQYLFQKNRPKVEEVVAEKEPPFKITISCKCSKCNG